LRFVGIEEEQQRKRCAAAMDPSIVKLLEDDEVGFLLSTAHFV
jgi:hypothetical protein